MTTVDYSVRIPNPHRHFITFEALFKGFEGDYCDIHLPAWRPGRYELGNFAKNIRDFTAYTENGDSLKFEKQNKDTWRIYHLGMPFSIGYLYYAAELNAGSSYLDHLQLYVNPVNCFFYCKEKPETSYQIHLDLPDDYVIACSLAQPTKHQLVAQTFDELADSPFIASPDLKHYVYVSRDIPFHIWMQGEVQVDIEKLLTEFEYFTNLQIDLFEDIPCEEYHFLFQFTPYFIRHGVEHCRSTVIALGPGSEFSQKNWMDELLGISCHELYHTWNVKNIRPIEMLPYDFSKENYSRLGFVTEGVTTYMGDLLLARSGVWSEREWFHELSGWFQNHFDNPGRHALSVADSSWDTWLDGYVAGIPGRKVSIYNEGALIAFICDVRILTVTAGKKSLDDVMLLMYQRFGKKYKGYTEKDYQLLLEEVSGVSFDDVFEDLINGTENYAPYLMQACQSVGLLWLKTASPKFSEAFLGFSLEETGGKLVVSEVVEDGPADRSGLAIGDEVLLINNVLPYKNTQSLLKEASSILVHRKNKAIALEFTKDESCYAWRHSVVLNTEASAAERHMLTLWLGKRVK